MRSPALGDRVLYRLSSQDVAAINRRRHDSHGLHSGNSVARGDVFPALVVRVFANACVNLQVALDGTDTFWATSRHPGPGDGHWTGVDQ